jgi:hypothetical protein
MDMLDLIVVFLVAFYLGHKLSSLWQQWTFARILDDLGVKPEQIKALLDEDAAAAVDEDGLTRLEVRVEQHQGVLFAYRTDTEEFLGQGTDKQTLIDSIARRLRDVRLVIHEGQGAELLRKNNT